MPNPAMATASYKIFEQSEPKEYSRVNFDLDLLDPVNQCDQPPQTTAKAWILFDLTKNLVINSKN